MEAARKEKAIDALNMAASFKTVAEDWLTTRVSGWSESYTKQVRSALKTRRPGHNAWIQINEIPAFYKALERAGSVQIQTAIRLLILTALRTAEQRLMRREWVDLESATITLPAEVMKTRRPHVVPLSGQST